jgi:hypothetical protein
VGKYVADLPSRNPELAVEKVEDFLHKRGFVQTGGQVWKRNARTRLLSPEYISVTAGDGHVHLKAWIKALTPFVGLWVGNANPYKGAPFSITSKERLRKRVEQIERVVR